jgi:hypothetical protein
VSTRFRSWIDRESASTLTASIRRVIPLVGWAIGTACCSTACITSKEVRDV